MAIIKQPAVCGIFYPADGYELNLIIEKFLEEEKLFDFNNIRALIAPHAGYIYSGKVAAAVFKQISNKNYKNVILIGPSHYQYFDKIALSSAKYWQMPFGKVEVYYPKNILENKNCLFSDLAYSKEHCLEVEIPFLQKVLENFKITPLLYGDIDSEILTNLILDVYKDEYLIVVSSDLSHYQNYEKAKEIDKISIQNILNFSQKQDLRIDACGKIGILALLKLAKIKNWHCQLIKYLNSGDTTGSKDAVVGYGGFVFYK